MIALFASRSKLHLECPGSRAERNETACVSSPKGDPPRRSATSTSSAFEIERENFRIGMIYYDSP
jgi:hypothetical protein